MDDLCQLNTKVHDDGLTASLVVPSSFDRSQLTPELCRSMLMRSGVELAATSDPLLEAFIADANVATDAFVGVAARGTPPTHGQDGYIEWAPPAGEHPTPDPAAHDNAEDQDQEPTSFYERSAFTLVKAGDILGHLHHATVGTDGRDVTGKNLAAKDGKALNFKHDKTVIVGKGNAIIAQIDGVFDRNSEVTCVRDTIAVDQYIDFNTGNIDFTGNVVIQKGIRDCFKVKADGDIEVRGLIEAATIIAGGELRALGGFAGREQGSATVAGDLTAKYLDAISADIRGNLMVDREVINCSTKVLGRIDSPTSSIIGGKTLVAGSVAVAEIGSEGMPITTLQIGVVPHLDPLLSELDQLIGALIDNREKLLSEQETIEKTSGAHVTSTHKERLCELMFEIAEVQTHLDRAEPSMKRASEKAESMRFADINVTNKVYPNTVLICAGLKYRIKNELKGPLHIYMDSKRQLKIEYNGNEPMMLAMESDLSEAA